MLNCLSILLTNACNTVKVTILTHICSIGEWADTTPIHETHKHTNQVITVNHLWDKWTNCCSPTIVAVLTEWWWRRLMFDASRNNYRPTYSVRALFTHDSCMKHAAHTNSRHSSEVLSGAGEKISGDKNRTTVVTGYQQDTRMVMYRRYWVTSNRSTCQNDRFT